MHCIILKVRMLGVELGFRIVAGNIYYSVNAEQWGAGMKESRMHEFGKQRVLEINPVDICNRAAIGTFVLWLIWISTSLLIHFMKG